MIKFIINIFILSLVVNCTSIKKKIDELTEIQVAQKTNVSQFSKNLFCSKNSSTEIILEDTNEKEQLSLYNSFILQSHLNFYDKSVLLILSEIVRRPDAFKTNSSFTIISKINNKEYFSTFSPQSSHSFPILKALHSFIQNSPSKIKFEQYLNLAEKYIPNQIPVSLELQNYIENNKKLILKNEIISQKFIKADQALTKYETFLREKYTNSFKNYNPNNDDTNIARINLISTFDNKNNNVYCNFSNIKSDDTPSSHYIGLKDHQNYFIAISSFNESTPEVIDPIYMNYFKNKDLQSELPICKINEKDKDIILISTSGRKPAQHLKHLISYGIKDAEGPLALQTYLNFSRHVFLNSPDRILYESKKGRKSQLDFFLTMNFPIYHVENIGDIIGVSQFKNISTLNHKLFVDERSHRQVWCY